MRRTIQVTVVGAAAALCACAVENNESLAILFNGARDDDCTLSPDTDKYFPRGILDVSLGAGYVAGFIVQNRMGETVTSSPVTTGSQQQETTERNLVTLRGFNIRLELECAETDTACPAVRAEVDADGVKERFEPASVAIEPDGGKGATGSELIPSRLATALAGGRLLGSSQYSIRTTVVARGGRNVDETLESGEFDYYVTLCDGCLVRGFDPPQPCPGGTEEGYCGLPQDGFLDCCFAGSQLYCPASQAPSAQ